MRVYFGTVARGQPLEKGGELVCVDWERKRVLRRVPMVPRNPDLDLVANTRGNARGCRGVAVYGDQVVAVNYHSVCVYDRDLNLQRTFSHPLMVDLHELHLPDGRDLWLSATAIDAVLRCRLDTGEVEQVLWPRDESALQDSLRLTPTPFDKTADNRTLHLHAEFMQDRSHLHLNAVLAWQGRVLGLFYRQGVVVDLLSNEVIVRHEQIKRAHNLLVDGEGRLYVNATPDSTVLVFDLSTGELITSYDLRSLSISRKLQRIGGLYNRVRGWLTGQDQSGISRPLFLRGLDVAGDLLFVGLAPATILCLNRQTGELLDSFRFANDPRYAIHGLQVQPAPEVLGGADV